MKYLFLLFTIACITIPASVSAHEKEKKSTFFPVWSYHDNNVNIIGLSLGLATFPNKPGYTDSYGIKIELIGFGLLSPLIPDSPVAYDLDDFNEIREEPLSENIYGLNVSLTGTFCDCKSYGLVLGGIGQYNFQINGLSASLFLNLAQVHNGIMVATLNQSFRMRGLQIGVRNMSSYAGGVQIGLRNSADDLRGIQIGVWNRNQKRSLPIINWSL